MVGVTFSYFESAPVPNVWNLDSKFFKLENPTLIKTPATIDSTEIQKYLYLNVTFIKTTQTAATAENKVTPDPGPFFHKFFIPAPGSKKGKSCRSWLQKLQIRGHICFTPSKIGGVITPPGAYCLPWVTCPLGSQQDLTWPLFLGHSGHMAEPTQLRSFYS